MYSVPEPMNSGPCFYCNGDHLETRCPLEHRDKILKEDDGPTECNTGS